LGKSIHLNRPRKKHNSGFDLLPIAVTEIKKRKLHGASLSAKHSFQPIDMRLQASVHFN